MATLLKKVPHYSNLCVLQTGSFYSVYILYHAVVVCTCELSLSQASCNLTACALSMVWSIFFCKIPLYRCCALICFDRFQQQLAASDHIYDFFSHWPQEGYDDDGSGDEGDSNGGIADIRTNTPRVTEQKPYPNPQWLYSVIYCMYIRSRAGHVSAADLIQGYKPHNAQYSVQ